MMRRPGCFPGAWTSWNLLSSRLFAPKILDHLLHICHSVPLFHVSERSRRNRSLREAPCIIIPYAITCTWYMSTFAAFRKWIRKQNEAQQLDIRRVLRTGMYSGVLRILVVVLFPNSKVKKCDHEDESKVTQKCSLFSFGNEFFAILGDVFNLHSGNA